MAGSTTAIERRESGALQPTAGELTVAEIKAKVDKVREVAASVMKKGIHYGVIPGTGKKCDCKGNNKECENCHGTGMIGKPTLLKPGSEILALTFRLAPKYPSEGITIDLGEGHRDYVVRCDLYHIETGQYYGSGLGSCSTKESKYRYRWDATGRTVPKKYWDTRDQSLLGGPNMVARKSSDQWFIFQRVEVDNPSDHYNTCLKIAAKRSFTDAILKATAASEVYNQDLEDLPENGMIAADEEIPVKTGNSKIIDKDQMKEIWRRGFNENTNRSALKKDEIIKIVQTCGFKRIDQIPASEYGRVITAIDSGIVPD